VRKRGAKFLETGTERNGAENFVSEAEQIDWVRIEDHRASMRRLLKASADRVGVPHLAHTLEQDPSTIRNQLAYRDGRCPSWELAALCFLLDSDFRSRAVGLCGEVLTKPGDLSPEEALRLIAAKAASEWDKRALADVHSIMGRVKR
jgi:hypothetical protein